MSRFNDYRSLSTILKRLRDEKLDENLIVYLGNEIKKRDLRIGNLISVIEIQNKTAIPINERKLETKIVNKNNTTIKVNPFNGKIVVMFSEKSSEKVIEECKNIVNDIMTTEFPPIVLHGTIRFQSDEKFYKCTLYSDSKKYSKTFIFKP